MVEHLFLKATVHHRIPCIYLCYARNYVVITLLAATGQPQAPASSQQQQPSQSATAFPATGTASAPGGQPAAQPTGQHTGQPGYPQNTQTAPGMSSL